MEVPDLVGPSVSLFHCRFAIVTVIATVLWAGLRLSVTSQGLVVVWTAVLCSLKVRPWGASGEGPCDAPQDSAMPCPPQTRTPSRWR